MAAEDPRDGLAVPRLQRRSARRLAWAALAVVVLVVLLLSHRFGRAEPTGDYRPELPPDALRNGCYPLPGGVDLELPYLVRSDGDVRIGDAVRRRLLGHYSLVDEAEAEERLVSSFTEAGFREAAGEDSLVEQGDLLGGEGRVLRKPGAGRVVIHVEPLPDTSEETLVRGTFVLDLPVAERASDSEWCDRPSSTKRWPDGLTPGESR